MRQPSLGILWLLVCGLGACEAPPPPVPPPAPSLVSLEQFAQNVQGPSPAKHVVPEATYDRAVLAYYDDLLADLDMEPYIADSLKARWHAHVAAYQREVLRLNGTPVELPRGWPADYAIPLAHETIDIQAKAKALVEARGASLLRSP